MDEIGTASAKPHRRHLVPAQTVAMSPGSRGEVDLTRHHGEGNGVRVHAVYFAVVSLVALLLVIAGVALAATTR